MCTWMPVSDLDFWHCRASNTRRPYWHRSLRIIIFFFSWYPFRNRQNEYVPDIKHSNIITVSLYNIRPARKDSSTGVRYVHNTIISTKIAPLKNAIWRIILQIKRACVLTFEKVPAKCFSNSIGKFGNDDWVGNGFYR